MTTITRIPLATLVAAAFISAACGGADRSTQQTPAAGSTPAVSQAPGGGPRVWITSPADGDTVSGPGVEIRMNVEGVRLVPADANRNPGEGHLHLFLDRDVTRPDVPIPVDENIVHLGTGASSHVFSSLTPGPHRIIVVFAYNDHTPYPAVAPDTVNIVVKPQ